MAKNLDLLNGGDSHKRWDILPSPGSEHPVIEVLDRIGSPRGLDYQEAAQFAVSLPSFATCPLNLRIAIQKIADFDPDEEREGDEPVEDGVSGLSDEFRHKRLLDGTM